MLNPKMAGLMVAAFVAGSFVASPELRAYAANTVGSADIINESILSADIKNGEVKTDDIAASAIGSARIKDNDVKAVDIAANAVGASELQGVTKLQFTACSTSATVTANHGVGWIVNCSVPGLSPSDELIVTKQDGNPCYVLTAAVPQDNNAALYLFNVCNSAEAPGTMTYSVIYYTPG